jgi:hypothetical protein
MSRLEILSVFWGKEHFELFKRGTLKSLGWTKNKKEIFSHRSTWNIFTDKENFLEIEKAIDIYLPELHVNLSSADDLRKYTDSMQSALTWQINECLKYKSKLLLAPPDTIFADGSLTGMIKAGREKETCVVLPHPRVLPGIFTEDLSLSVSQPEFVDLAWKHLHRSWADAEVDHKMRNSFSGGVSWQRLSPTLIEVQHRLPTPYLLNFTIEDLQYFETCPGFGHFDHQWANDVLIPRGRQRFIGSSDGAFVVEVTDKEKNVPPIWPGDVDSFWKRHTQAEHNKQFLSYFRGSHGNS